MKYQPPKGIILPGEKFNAHVHWSTRDDGPMNIIGREFPQSIGMNPVFDGGVITGTMYRYPEAGDTERLANRASFLSRIGLEPSQTAIPKLVHGADIKYVTEHNAYVEDLIGDGMVTDRAKFALTVGFGDCPSIVLFDGTSGALCLIHAGWKGIAGGIVEKSLSTMMSFGAQKHRIQAFIGPGVRRCCYELDPVTASSVDGIAHQGHVHVDLQLIIGMRLAVQGVPAENIKVEEACTCCATVDSKEGKKPLYYSYRREKTLDPLNTGMMVVSFY